MGSVKEANKKDFDLLCSFMLILNNVATVHAEDLTQNNVLMQTVYNKNSRLLGLVCFMKNYSALPEHHVTGELC